MAQSTSKYVCDLEKDYNFADLQRDDVDDLQEGHISDRAYVAIALIGFYFIYRTFVRRFKFAPSLI